uniref:RNase H type-1 domain-containing protein n=1 Tax=Fagus sylvatica TaxID=28930 RepID=A0A2N9HFN3_FAGSY
MVLTRARSMEKNLHVAGPSGPPPPKQTPIEKQVQTLAENIQELTRQNQILMEKFICQEANIEREVVSPKDGEESRKEHKDETKGESHKPHARTIATETTVKWGDELREVKVQMGEIQDAVKSKNTKNLDCPVHKTDSPFTGDMVSYPLPSKFRTPQLESFDGSKDPLDHLESFKTMMCLQGLSKHFVNHFIGGQRHGRPTTHLLNDKQKDGESLRSYLTKFNREVLLVDEAHDKVVLIAFIFGPQPCNFLFSMYKDPPSTMAEMMYEAQKYMNEEDALQARDVTSRKKRKFDTDDRLSNSRMKSQRTNERGNEGRKRHKERRHEDRRHEDRRKLRGRFTSFTPLTILVDQVFYHIQDNPALKWPGKLRKSLDKRDKDKHCRFHRDHGHNTEDCFVLKQQIEEFIKPSLGEIYVVVGGMAAGGTSRSSRKAYALQIHNVLVTQKALKAPRIGEMRGDQAMARECYLTSIDTEKAHQTLMVEGRRNILEPLEVMGDIALVTGDDKKTTMIRTTLSKEIRAELINFLKANADVFRLGLKGRVFAPERNVAVMEEVEKLLTARFIREVYYPEWLANVVMVKKSSGKWRMCVDFTDLNKACPKDSYPLPRIDQLVDSTVGHKLLSFMDTFSSYNQMDEADQEKTAFITSHGLFYYKVMPFGIEERRSNVSTVGKQDVPRLDRKECRSLYGRHTGQKRGRCKPFGRLEGNSFYSKGRVIPLPSGINHRCEFRLDKRRRSCLEARLLHWTIPERHKKAAMNKPDTARRLVLWAIEMIEFDVDYRPRTAIKAQALANFIAEFTHLDPEKKWRSDSQLVVGQVRGEYEAREERMKKYLKLIQKILETLEKVDFCHIPREENADADHLTRLASSGEEGERIIEYLKGGVGPENKKEAHKLRVRATRFVLLRDVLYKMGFSKPYLRCLAPKDAELRLERGGGRAFGNHHRKECEKFRLESCHLSFWDPKVEITNRTLLKMIKTRLEGAKGLWVEELPSILWVYTTTARTPTKETLFKLTFGTEAIIPVEIGMTGFRTAHYCEGKNEDLLRLNLNLIDEEGRVILKEDGPILQHQSEA